MPVRGVTLETLDRYPEAKRDYEAVLAVSPDDAAAWNNLGNVNAASLDWEGALQCYSKAAELVRPGRMLRCAAAPLTLPPPSLPPVTCPHTLRKH